MTCPGSAGEGESEIVMPLYFNGQELTKEDISLVRNYLTEAIEKQKETIWSHANGLYSTDGEKFDYMASYVSALNEYVEPPEDDDELFDDEVPDDPVTEAVNKALNGAEHVELTDLFQNLSSNIHKSVIRKITEAKENHPENAESPQAIYDKITSEHPPLNFKVDDIRPKLSSTIGKTYKTAGTGIPTVKETNVNSLAAKLGMENNQKSSTVKRPAPQKEKQLQEEPALTGSLDQFIHSAKKAMSTWKNSGEYKKFISDLETLKAAAMALEDPSKSGMDKDMLQDRYNTALNKVKKSAAAYEEYRLKNRYEDPGKKERGKSLVNSQDRRKLDLVRMAKDDNFPLSAPRMLAEKSLLEKNNASKKM